MTRNPDERYNVTEQHPELVQDLKKLAEQARKDLGDNLSGAPGSNLRLPGKL